MTQKQMGVSRNNYLRIKCAPKCKRLGIPGFWYPHANVKESKRQPTVHEDNAGQGSDTDQHHYRHTGNATVRVAYKAHRLCTVAPVDTVSSYMLCARCFKTLLLTGGEPGSSVSVVSGYGLDERAIEVRSPAEAKGFYSSSL
jgi:hypothetical protein